MSRISIVGVDGSGKTVLMAAFGEKYERPDAYGYFLAANTPQTFHTVKMLMSRMRKGQWPSATGTDAVTNLEWTLLKRNDDVNDSVCSVSFLDYAGEIYRLAFGEHTEEECLPFKEQIRELREYVASSDALLVLINLKDIVSGNLSQVKTREMLWISRNIFDYALGKNPAMKSALAFSQSDIYRVELEQAGGLQAAYKKYLSHIESLYPTMKILSVSAVNRTTVNAEGFEIPAEDFESEGLESVLEWIVSAVPGREGEIAYQRNLPEILWGKVVNGRKLIESGTVLSNEDRLRMLKELTRDLETFRQLPEAKRQGIATEESCDEMALYLTGALAKAGEFEQLLLLAREKGSAAAEAALAQIPMVDDCTEEELMLVRNEIATVVANVRAVAARVRSRKRKTAAVVTAVVAAVLLLAGGWVKLVIDAEREQLRARQEEVAQRRRQAEMQELETKKNAGYAVVLQRDGKMVARWEAGRVPPANDNLVTTESPDVYRVTRPGYAWVPGTLTDVWTPGLAYPEKEGVVAGAAEGEWVAAEPGYTVDAQLNLFWQAGLLHPQNGRLKSLPEEGKWESTEAGWTWTGGSVTVWQIGVQHPNDSKLVSLSEPGKWTAAEAGYAWDGGSRAVWQPGLGYPERDGVIAGSAEGEWVSTKPGYAVDCNRRLVWKAGLPHPQNRALKSAQREGQWDCTKPGWTWSGGSAIAWQRGVIHPNDSKLISKSETDKWESRVPGYVWNGGSYAVWTSGLRHPENANLVSLDKVGEWKSTRPGYRWAGDAKEEWTPGVVHTDHPHVLAAQEPGNWKPAPGYTWCSPGSSSNFDVKWKPGVVVGGRKSGFTEGRWLSQVDCSFCSGRGRRSVRRDCSRCNGWGTVSGRVDCSICNGSGRVTDETFCFQCSGNGSAMFTCTEAAHRMRCPVCGGRGQFFNGFMWMPCAACLSSGHVPCHSCGNRGVSWQSCNLCGGDGRVENVRDCYVCSGSGRVDGSVTCSRCDGNRRVNVTVDCSICSGNDCATGKVWERE